MAVKDIAWTNRELLLQNRERMTKELHAKVRGFEARYEMSSVQMEAALVRGDVRETAEICEWVIALHTLRALEAESEPSRLE